MTRECHLWASSPLVRLVSSIATVIAATVAATPVMAQNSDWRVVENPYQEDIEYSIGTTHVPNIEIDGVRWRSFRIEAPDSSLLVDGKTVKTELTLEFENRRTKSAKILVIFLLEDENANPLERIEAKQFKVAGGRLKEKKETANLPSEVIRSARRVYVFFEVLD